MPILGARVVIVGLGRSGIAAANLCLRKGANVVATDIRTRDQVSDDVFALERNGATLVLGGHDAVAWSDAELVVVSPGVPELRPLLEVQRDGREVISELELASRFVTAPIALVGGTNGKSTVTTWLGLMLSSGNTRVFAGGNLGQPLAEVVGVQEFDAIVLEVSSFQAERIPTLHPRAAALLNITDDHLDRYAGFDSYAYAKGNMFVCMGPEDVAVIPASDDVCRRQAARGAGRVVTFGPGGDVTMTDTQIEDQLTGRKYPLASIKLSGHHNRLNACAAVAMAGAMGGTEDGIRRALENFTGLAHRAVRVGELHGVRFYDDSKGTNVGAAVASLRGLTESRVVLIAGGRDKLGSYAPLVDALREKGRGLVLIGEAADRIQEAAEGVLPIARAPSMLQAVESAFEMARPQDAVLLSPACSSYDMFTDYKHRGAIFVAEVEALIRRVAPAQGYS